MKVKDSVLTLRLAFDPAVGKGFFCGALPFAGSGLVVVTRVLHRPAALCAGGDRTRLFSFWSGHQMIQC